uniref:O-antigen ligase family protein n=1 Tax=Acetatifactor sp. TaxID=1872090 RepID=UPI00405635DA
MIDQRIKTCSGLDGWLEAFRDLTGVVMAVIIMSHYRLEEFRKWKVPYIIWSAIWVAGIIPALLWGKAKPLFMNDWSVVLLNVILYGYIIIHTFIFTVIEKRMPRFNKSFAILWLVMMLWMILSRSEYIWPFTHLVMFGCFYLTDYTKEEQNDLFQGILNGIILAFFLIQGWGFVFRPYDSWDCRYVGSYSNCNLNALFYLEVLAATFAKIIYVTKMQANKWIKIFYWLGTGVVFSLIFMTIGRIAWLTAFVIGLVFLCVMKMLQKKKTFLKNGLLLILCACLMFPLVFGAVRYLPPVFHHPVWHFGEWSNEKVHSWDSWDSEKYVDLDEFMDAAVGRITKSIGDIFAYSPLTLRVEAAENTISDIDPRVEAAVLTQKEAENGFLVRKTIYEHYISNLNLWGYPYEEQGFQLHPTYWIGHAHNIFLQYGTDFGIPMMIIFIVLILWSLVEFAKRIRNRVTEQSLGYLLFVLIPAFFGMFEYSWGVGSITILLLLVTWRNMICKEETE